MAVRTSPDAVKLIMEECDLQSDEINSFVKTANLVVTEVFSGDTDVSALMLSEIEKWYAAHLIASTRMRMAKREKLGDAEIEYTGKFGEKLSSTPYGQAVQELDTTGKMQNIGKRKATLYAIKSFDE